MKFYDTIFVSAYNSYGKYYEPKRARFRAILFVVLHVAGLLFILLAIIRKLFNLDLSESKNLVFLIGFIIFFACIKFFLSYFSNAKVDEVFQKFELKSKMQKIAIGWMTILTFILEFVLYAILLKK